MIKPQILIEEVESSLIETKVIEEGKKKVYKFKGPFAESNIRNHNKRIYPGPVLKKEIDRFQKVISEGRAVGELEHPSRLEISLPEVSHKITSLKFVDDNIVMGEAIILDTPRGLIAKSLIDGGVKLATSTRGAGTLKEGVVQNDFSYITNDIVFTPSAPHCFVDSILEQKADWLIENGILYEKEIETLKNRLKNFKGDDIATVLSGVFENALNMVMKK